MLTIFLFFVVAKQWGAYCFWSFFFRLSNRMNIWSEIRNIYHMRLVLQINICSISDYHPRFLWTAESGEILHFDTFSIFGKYSPFLWISRSCQNLSDSSSGQRPRKSRYCHWNGVQNERNELFFHDVPKLQWIIWAAEIHLLQHNRREKKYYILFEPTKANIWWSNISKQCSHYSSSNKSNGITFIKLVVHIQNWTNGQMPNALNGTE